MPYAPHSASLSPEQRVAWSELMELKRPQWPAGLDAFMTKYSDKLHNMESIHDFMAQWVYLQKGKKLTALKEHIQKAKRK